MASRAGIPARQSPPRNALDTHRADPAAFRESRLGIVLGGGRSRRMGTDKMAIVVEGAPLLQRTVSAALAWAGLVVVVAPRPKDWPHTLHATFTLENPPFGGPVAGIAAGLAAAGIGNIRPPVLDRPPVLEEEPTLTDVLILAGDLAHPDAAVSTLAASPLGVDGTVLEDEDGWPQYLAGRYRASTLTFALDRIGPARDVSVRRLMRPLHLHRVMVPPTISQDLDTPDALIRTFDPS